MPNNASSNRARNGCPMWYTAAADFARKKFGVQSAFSSANRSTSGQSQNFPGMGNRLVLNRNAVNPTSRASNVNAKRNRRSCLNSSLRNGYPASRTSSVSPSPQVVDMQVPINSSELPIFRRKTLMETVTSASSVKSPAAKRVAAAIESDEDNEEREENISVPKRVRDFKVLNLMDSLQANSLPLIMVAPSPRRVSKVGSSLSKISAGSKRASNTSTSSTKPKVPPKPKNEAVTEEPKNSTEIEIIKDPVDPSTDETTTVAPAEPTVVSESASEPVTLAEAETRSEAEIMNETNDTDVREPEEPLEDLEMECKFSPATLRACSSSESPACSCSLPKPNDMTGMCDSINSQDNVLTSCEVTEAHYLSFPCDDQSQTNAEENMQSNNWNTRQFVRPHYMCPGQLGRASCVDANQQTSFHSYGYPQMQSPPRRSFNGHTCCNRGVSWPRQNFRHQQMQMQVPTHSSYSMCSQQQEPPEQKQMGLTELLAQQLKQQMQQAQVQIAQVQMQLSSSCCGQRMQKMQALVCEVGNSNSEAIKHTVIDSEQESDILPNNTLPICAGPMRGRCSDQLRPINERPVGNGRFQLNQFPSAHASAQPSPQHSTQQTPLRVCPSAPPTITLGFFSVKSATTQNLQAKESDTDSHSDCDSDCKSSSSAHSQHMYAPRQLQTQCACQQQHQSFQPQQQLFNSSTHFPGNHFNCQPCCRQRFAQMRFMLPHYWPGH